MRLAQTAVALIEDGVLEERGLEGLADALGVTSRHVRRIFAEHFGVAPVAYAQTQRLLMAKRLLTDTALPVTDVAFASGFRSVRRFNALFRQRYRMAPGRLRRHAVEVGAPAPLRFELAYRPPYAWQAMLEFLALRAIDGVEVVERNRYRRTLRIVHDGTLHAGWITVAPVVRRPALAVEVSPSLARAVAPVLARVRQAFDLSCDPDAVAAALGALAHGSPGLRVPGTVDGFELAVRAIVGQQVSVRAARTLLSRLCHTLGDPLPAASAGLACWFPTPERVVERGAAALVEVGILPSRARSVVALARGIAEGALRLDLRADMARTMAALRSIPGIGPWTAELIAMRALGWPDAFPSGDGALLRVLGETSAARAAKRSVQWQPWRSYAVMHLWRQG